MRFLRHNRRFRELPAGLASVLFLAAAFAFGGGAHAAPAPNTVPSAGSDQRSAIASLPEAPEKALVLKYCQVCHDLDWIVRSGATKEGWEDRLVRMIRAGATIPREQIPAVAAYLAKALPPRAAPPDLR